MPLLSSELDSSVGTRAVNSVLSIDEETQEADANELPRSPGRYTALTVREPQGASWPWLRPSDPSLLSSLLCALSPRCRAGHGPVRSVTTLCLSFQTCTASRVIALEIASRVLTKVPGDVKLITFIVVWRENDFQSVPVDYRMRADAGWAVSLSEDGTSGLGDLVFTHK